MHIRRVVVGCLAAAGLWQVLTVGAARAGLGQDDAWALPAGVPSGTVTGVTAVEYASGLSEPVAIAHSGLMTDTRLFVVERAGRIRVVQADGQVMAAPYLDLTSKVRSVGPEEGLLSLAFHPDFGQMRHFFVHYVNTDGDLQLSRFSAGSVDDNTAQTTETPLLTIVHNLNVYHNGGDLNFGPDGYLYFSVGDGGYSNRAQLLTFHLGKVLRLDVTGVPTYTIPASNPFTATVGAKPEIWAYGLRNPWRTSFDRLTGDFYITDVGQNLREEVNFQPAGSAGGESYGWRCYEGSLVYNLTNCAPEHEHVFPIVEYGRSMGYALTGGYVYRGQQQPGMQGYYLFADFGSSRFWAMQPDTRRFLPLSGVNVSNPSTFGEDANGELYVASFGGKIYRLEGSIQFYESFLPIVER